MRDMVPGAACYHHRRYADPALLLFGVDDESVVVSAIRAGRPQGEWYV